MINIRGRVSSGQGVVNRIREIQRKLAQNKEVAVGLPADSGNHPDGMSMVRLGAIHEFGAPGAGIPERSFLRVPLRSAQDELASVFKKLMQQVQSGDLTFDQALNQLGAKGASISQEAISAGIDPANAPATVAAKGSSRPLVDTGALRQSITWVVRDKGI